MLFKKLFLRHKLLKMPNLNSENYKISMKEIKDLNKQKDIPSSQIRRQY